MPLKPLPFKVVRQKLFAAGFQEAGQEGSHVKFAKSVDGNIRTAIVPNHREVALGTLRSILRQAGISVDEWEIL